MDHDNEPHLKLMDIRLDAIGSKVDVIGGKLTEVLTALMGSTVGNDGGIVRRIEELEKGHIEILAEQDLLKQKNIKMEVYQKIMWAAVGGTVGLVFSYVVNLMFTR